MQRCDQLIWGFEVSTLKRWRYNGAHCLKFLSWIGSQIGFEGVQETEHSEVMYDDPRVAGGPDVLSESAAPSQAETKHKATEPA